MSFVCPECRGASLEIGPRMQLPSDSRSDDISVQVVQCARCDFRAVAIYEESRRGASDLWQHFGYHLAADDINALVAMIERCPNPQDRRCRCPSHQALGRRNASGRWIPPKGLRTSFPMEQAVASRTPVEVPQVATPASSAPSVTPQRMPTARGPRIGPQLRRLAAGLILFVILIVGMGAGAIVGALIGEETGALIGMPVGLFVSLTVIRLLPDVLRRLGPGPRKAPAAMKVKPAPMAEEVRKLALRRIAEQSRASNPLSSPEWTSYTGHDYARAGRRGVSLAEGVLHDTGPGSDESPRAYLERVKARVRQLRDEYRKRRRRRGRRLQRRARGGPLGHQ